LLQKQPGFFKKYIKSPNTSKEVFMGKKSLTKSTTKKKATTSKKSETPPKSEAPKKQAVAAPPKPAAPPKKAKSTAPKKSAATPKPTIAFLIQKDFGAWAPESKYIPPMESMASLFTAPPFIDESYPDSARIRSLLAKEFDLTIPDSPEEPMVEAQIEEKGPQAIEEPVEQTKVQTPPAAIKKEPIPISELLNLKFEDWQPPSLFSVEPDANYLKGFSAPPAIDSADPKEIDRIKALLFKTIDLTVIEIQRPPADQKEPAKETPQPATSPAVKESVMEPVQAKETPPQAPKTEVKEESKAIETSKAPEKPTLPPDPKQAAPPKEAPKAAPVSQKPAPKPPEKEIDAIKPLAWAEAPKPAVTFDRGLQILSVCIVAFFAFLFLASGINSGKYYLVPSEAGLEIWKGKFSPSGKRLMMTVPGVELTEPLKKSYTKAEAFIPAFNHYLRQADELSGVKGTPDFEAIKVQLKNAQEFAPTQNDMEMVLKRLNTIDFTFLLYNANTVSRKRTPENIEKALGFLNEAKALDLDNAQLEMLEKKINELKPTAKPQEPSKGETASEKKMGH
jgi:colicin import membrane protein